MATDTLDFELQKTIRLLPGYDPFAQAGDCTFDEEAARFVIDFVQKCCTHVKGKLAGTPLILEPWQKAIYANLFGWKRPDGTRRYREALIFVPRGNSKTTMAAALMCIGLFLEPEPGAELYSSAAEREQARLCFEIVTGMIRNEPLMEERAQLYKYSIVVGDKSYKALSAEAGSKHGFNVQLLVNDELHAHKTPELTEVLMTGMGKRSQPLVVHLTTSDFEREGSICNQKHDYACKVRDGLITDPSFLPVIYEASKEDDWTNLSVWEKANPNLRISVPLDYLERECKRAQDEPAYENTFKRLHLNIRTEQSFRLIPMKEWNACDGPVEIPDKARVWIGVDLASIEDMASAVVCWRNEDIYYFKPYFWCPGSQVARLERGGRPEYAMWQRAGLLTVTAYASIDFTAIRAKLNELAGKYDVQEIAFDPYNARHLMTELHDEDRLVVFEHRQGWQSMNEPIKRFLAAMLNHQLRHGGHPILRWNAQNVAACHDKDDNLRFDKASSGGKIDGMVAAVMAFGRAAIASQHPRKSFYEDHDAEWK